VPEEAPSASQEEEIGLEVAGREPMRDLNEAGVQNCYLSASEPLVKLAGGGKVLLTTEAQLSPRTSCG